MKGHGPGTPLANPGKVLLKVPPTYSKVPLSEGAPQAKVPPEKLWPEVHEVQSTCLVINGLRGPPIGKMTLTQSKDPKVTPGDRF